MPGAYDLKLYRGDSYAWRFTLWADDARTVPADLTGATVAAEVRDKPAGSTVVALVCVVTLPNIVDVTLGGVSWLDMPASGAWDLQVTYAAGEVHTAVAGKVTVTTDVTASTASSGSVLRSPVRVRP